MICLFLVTKRFVGLELGSLYCGLIVKIDGYVFVIPLIIIHLTDLTFILVDVMMSLEMFFKHFRNALKSELH